MWYIFLVLFLLRPCVLCKRVLMCSVAMAGSLLPSLPWNLLKWYVNPAKFVFPQIASVWSVVFSKKVKRLNLVVVAAIFRRRNLSSGLTIIQSEFFLGAVSSSCWKQRGLSESCFAPSTRWNGDHSDASKAAQLLLRNKKCIGNQPAVN